MWVLRRAYQTIFGLEAEEPKDPANTIRCWREETTERRKEYGAPTKGTPSMVCNQIIIVNSLSMYMDIKSSIIKDQKEIQRWKESEGNLKRWWQSEDEVEEGKKRNWGWGWKSGERAVVMWCGYGLLEGDWTTAVTFDGKLINGLNMIRELFIYDMDMRDSLFRANPWEISRVSSQPYEYVLSNQRSQTEYIFTSPRVASLRFTTVY